LALAYILLQLASNAAHGPAQGLIPDLVPATRRGLASGIKNLFDMAGLVVTSLIAGQLMASGRPSFALLIVAIVLLVSTLVTVLATPESGAPSTEESPPRSSGTLRKALTAYPAYTRLLFSRFLILMGIYTVQSFTQYYVRDWLGVPAPAAVTGNLMAAIGVALTLLVFPAGWLSDRVGRWPLNIGAGIAASVGLFLLVTVRDVTMLYVVGALIGMATGVFLSVNWALATDLIPQDEGGKYLGLSNLATAGAGAASRLGGPLIDGLNALLPGRFLGYPITFAVAAIVTLAGALLLAGLRRRVRAGTLPDGAIENLATEGGL
jgi:MFS family permease